MAKLTNGSVLPGISRRLAELIEAIFPEKTRLRRYVKWSFVRLADLVLLAHSDSRHTPVYFTGR